MGVIWKRVVKEKECGVRSLRPTIRSFFLTYFKLHSYFFLIYMHLVTHNGESFLSPETVPLKR